MFPMHLPAQLAMSARRIERTYKRLRSDAWRTALRSDWIGQRINRPWLARRYLEIMKQPLRLAPPIGFNDRVVHRMLYDRDPMLKRICDKVAVREVIRERVGAEFIVPLLGIWSDAADIAWPSLPEGFVLKPSHGSGIAVLVRPTAELNRDALARQAQTWLQKDYFDQSFEWGYLGVPRRILAEPLLRGPDGELPAEPQVMTFGGRAAMIRVLTGPKSTPQRRDNWFDAEGAPLSFHSLKIPRGDYRLAPSVARRLVEVAERAAKGFQQLRVDFYLTADGLRIGELTPYHGAGLNRWSEPGCDRLLGRLWQDPNAIGAIPDLGQAIRDAAPHDPSPWIAQYRRVVA